MVQHENFNFTILKALIFSFILNGAVNDSSICIVDVVYGSPLKRKFNIGLLMEESAGVYVYTVRVSYI